MTKLDNAGQILDLLNVFYVDGPDNLPERIQETVQYLKDGLAYARRHTPQPYEQDCADCIQILNSLKNCFVKCTSLPERGMILQDSKIGFQVNVLPIIEFLKRTEADGQVRRNFDVVQTLLRHYIHQENFLLYKNVGQFIQDVETALYDYQNP